MQIKLDLVVPSVPLQTIARLTFPAYKGDKISVALADKINHDQDAWLVDLAQIENAGPNVATATAANRDILPISSGIPILPTQSAEITAHPQRAFRCERFMISGAGTSGGAADWIVRDIRIGGRSQFVQGVQGDVPGDAFATNAIDAFVRFETAQATMAIAVSVTYIGLNEGGCPFFGSMVGMFYEEKPEYIRVAADRRDQQIPVGCALVSRDGSSITIYIPSIDQATIDVAVDAILAYGTPTKEVHAMIENALEPLLATNEEPCHELVHATYVALVEQHANALTDGGC
jgi:hypothetical protein